MVKGKHKVQVAEGYANSEHKGNPSLDSESSSDDESAGDLEFDISSENDPLLEHSDPTMLDTTKPQDMDRQSVKDRGTHDETIRTIIHSCYKGDTQAEGEMNVQILNENDQTPPSRFNPAPIMKWIHLESQYQSFDYFSDFVRDCPSISQRDRVEAIALLCQSREHERSILTANGMRGKYFEPFLDEATSHFDDQRETDSSQKIQLLCLPYLSLEPYSSHVLQIDSTLHPVRTLLQHSYSLTPKKRDLSQAICGLEHTKHGHCFHVPQLWALVINNNILLTCSNLSFSKIQELGNVNPLPFSRNDHHNTYIHVTDGGSRTWLLPLEDCKSWFEFTANFWNMSGGKNFNDNFEVWNNGRVIKSDEWARFLAKQPATSISLSIRKNRSRKNHSQSLFKSDFADFEKMMNAEVISSKADDKVSPKNETQNIDDPNSSKQETSSSKSQPKPEGIPDLHLSKNKDWSDVSGNNFHYFLWITAIKSSNHPNDRIPTKRNGKQKEVVEDTNKFYVDVQKLDTLDRRMQTALESSEYRNGAVFRDMSPRAYAEVKTLVVDLESNLQLESVIDSLETDEQNLSELDQVAPSDVSRKPGSESSNPSLANDFASNPPVAYSNSHAKRSSVPIPYWRRRVLCIAHIIFAFFVPLQYSSHITSKYWGAVYLILQQRRIPEGFINDEDETMTDMLIELITISRDLSGEGPLPYKIKLPDEFSKAWLHLTMHFVLLAENINTGKFRPRRAQLELEKSSRLISQGKRKLYANTSQMSLPELEGVFPLGIVSMIAKRLIEDVTPKQQDLYSTYLEYWKLLEVEIQRNPYDRAHQEKIFFFRQETEIVLKILKEQLGCVRDLRNKITPGDIGTRQLSHYEFPKEREAYILERCVPFIQARIYGMENLGRVAAEKAEWNLRHIERNKDRQEAAILVFTIVTIIFLPISFVTSFLGMNTSDIRNTNSSQWLFWAIAIPLTVFVIGITVVLVSKMANLRNVWKGVRDFWEGRGGGGRGKVLRDENVALANLPPRLPAYYR